ncbi:glycosyltransferase [Rhodococcus sp. NPDC077669]|uniref:glycosyltransferase family 2 protein n=1 Tax=Rhodococcus sp. NPDC077669 TaxID=3155174 RepID=UPI0034308B66
MTDNFWVVGLVDYNSSADTDRCVTSLLSIDMASAKLQILVVDNSGSYASDNPSVKVLSPGKNLGYAGAVNILMHAARLLDVDYLWILNNDCEVRADCLVRYMDAISVNSHDLYTSVSTYGDRRTVWYAGGFVDRRSGRTAHVGYGSDRSYHSSGATQATSWASGANIVVPKSTLIHASDWRQDFFLYLEELEWQMSSRYSVGLVQHDLVVHHAGSSTVAVSSDLEFAFSARNRLKIVRSLPDFSFVLWIGCWIVDFILKPLSKRQWRRVLIGAISPLTVFVSGEKLVQVCRTLSAD